MTIESTPATQVLWTPDPAPAVYNRGRIKPLVRDGASYPALAWVKKNASELSYCVYWTDSDGEKEFREFAVSHSLQEVKRYAASLVMAGSTLRAEVALRARVHGYDYRRDMVWCFGECTCEESKS